MAPVVRQNGAITGPARRANRTPQKSLNTLRFSGPLEYSPPAIRPQGRDTAASSPFHPEASHALSYSPTTRLLVLALAVVALLPLGADAYINTYRSREEERQALDRQERLRNPKTVYDLCERAEHRDSWIDWDGAYADYTEALRRAPNLTGARMKRGDLLWRRSNFIGAIADYEETLKRLGPDRPCLPGLSVQTCYVRLALAYTCCPETKFRNAAKAVAAAERAWGKEADHKSLERLAEVYARTGDFDAAVKRQNQALAALRKPPQGAYIEKDAGSIAQKRLEAYQERKVPKVNLLQKDTHLPLDDED